MMRAMRQVRLGLVMVWLVGCSSSSSSSVDAPGSPIDGPVSGGADARVADAPTGGGSPDAPAGGADAPVVMADAPIEMPDAPVEMADAPSTPDASLCGNGVVDPGESCDTAIPGGNNGACPTMCTSLDLCTTATLTGAGTCQATCATQAVAATNGDGLCCPPATSANDDDCVNTAFRLTSLVLQDPHVYTSLLSGGASCDDITSTVNNAVAGDLTTDDGHGHLSLSPVALFQPLNDKAGATTQLEVVFPTCTSGATTMCTATGASPRFGPETATNSAADATDPCLDVIAGTHRDTYNNIDLPIPACVSSSFDLVSLQIPVVVPLGPGIPGTLFLSLEDVHVAATYHPSATNANDTIVHGLIRGFLTHTSAMNMGGHPSRLDANGLVLPLEGFLAGGSGNCSSLNDTDTDENASDTGGWYFYMNFTAVKTPYTEQ